MKKACGSVPLPWNRGGRQGQGFNLQRGPPSWFVYIVECANRSLYTGIAKDLDRRLGEHNARRGGRYTASFGPVRLLWKEEKADRSSAARREAQIKRWTRRMKWDLIGSGDEGEPFR